MSANLPPVIKVESNGDWIPPIIKIENKIYKVVK